MPLSGFRHRTLKRIQLPKMERKVLHFHQQSFTLAQKCVHYCFEERQHINQSPLSNKIKVFP